MAHVSKKSGHTYAWDRNKKQSRMEHVIEYEKRHGEKPKGTILHHKDFSKDNSSDRNIVAVDPRTHGLLHAGAQIRGGYLKKQCAGCEQWLDPDVFYAKRTRYCPQCYNARTEALRKIRDGEK